MKMHVVFDLDECLVHNLQFYTYTEGDYTEYFRKNNLFVKDLIFKHQGEEYNISHIIHPGAIEFIKALLINPDITISFFSSGIRARNIKIVDELIMYAAGENYDEIRNQIIVLSKEDLTYNSDNLEAAQRKNYKGFFHGNYKKDLLKITSTLDNTILIDDDKSWVLYGQEKNLLKVFGATSYEFRGVRNQANEYNLVKNPEYLNVFKFIQTNQLFYAMGLFMIAQRKAEMKNISLSDALYSIQFPAKQQEKPIYPIYEKLAQNLYYYQIGFEELKKHNRNLEMYLPDGCTLDHLIKNVAKMCRNDIERLEYNDLKLIGNDLHNQVSPDSDINQTIRSQVQIFQQLPETRKRKRDEKEDVSSIEQKDAHKDKKQKV